MVTRRAAASVLVLCGLLAAINSWGETTAEVLWGYEGKRGPAHWVSWIVMTEPATLSAAQIAAFGALYPRNYRPVQPLGRRTLGRDKGGRDE